RCSIRLNWRLVMLDDELVTYVIVHELCHTAYHDHSSQFWDLVGRLMPNYKSVKKRLKSFSVLTTMYR
ncbi:MAG: M48 family metallopeptidase, partial [Clostridiales bacterium]|nr:M48 family metallopeptidase [Clostridiales bacterium]